MVGHGAKGLQFRIQGHYYSCHIYCETFHLVVLISFWYDGKFVVPIAISTAAVEHGVKVGGPLVIMIMT